MRFIATVMMLMLSVAFVTAQDQGRVTKREARELVEEYGAAATTSNRKTEIVERLKEGDSALAASPLKRAVGEEDTVGPAIELAKLLRVSGLFSDAADYLDGDFEVEIIAYGLSMQERNAGSVVWQRWKSKDPNGTLWKLANDGLLKHAVPLDVIHDMKRFLDSTKVGDDLREPCATILRFQLGAGDIGVDELNQEWTSLVKAYKLDAKSFGLSGRDLLAGDKVQWGSVVPIGQNYRLKPGSGVTVESDDTWQEDTFTVVVRVRVVEECVVKIWLQCAANDGWMVTFEDGDWTLLSNRGEHALHGEIGEWTEIRFQATKADDGHGGDWELRKARHCKISVDGKNLITTGSLHGEMKKLQIRVDASDSGSCVVGGAEFIHK